MKRHSARFAVLLLLATPALWAQHKPWSEQDKLVMGPYLTRAGYDLDDLASLLRATRDKDTGAQAAALVGLRLFPSSPAILAAIQPFLSAKNESLFALACQSLGELKDTSWLSVARARVPSMQQTSPQIAVISAMASSGDYSGWPILKQIMTSSEERYVQHALWNVDRFSGMKDEAGKDVDVAHEIEVLAPHLSDNMRKEAATRVHYIRLRRGEDLAGELAASVQATRVSQPVILTVILRNVSGNDVAAFKTACTYTFDVADDKGQAVSRTANGLAQQRGDCPSSRAEELHAGQSSLPDAINLADYFEFSRPGTYSVTVRREIVSRDSGSQEPRSAPVTFELRP